MQTQSRLTLFSSLLRRTPRDFKEDTTNNADVLVSLVSRESASDHQTDDQDKGSGGKGHSTDDPDKDNGGSSQQTNNPNGG